MRLAESENPYAPPSAEIVVPDGFGKLRREGKYLVVPNKWRTPPICLFTGDTDDLTSLRRAQLTWMDPRYSLLMLAAIVPYLLAGLFVQKRGTFYYCLSKRFAGKHLVKVVLNWMLVLLSQIIFVFDIGLFPWAVAIWVINAVLATTWCRLIKTAKIDSHFIYLIGIPGEVQDKIIRMDEARRAAVNPCPAIRESRPGAI